MSRSTVSVFRCERHHTGDHFGNCEPGDELRGICVVQGYIRFQQYLCKRREPARVDRTSDFVGLELGGGCSGAGDFSADKCGADIFRATAAEPRILDHLEEGAPSRLAKR